MFDRAMLRCWAVLMLGLLAACAGQQPNTASPAPTAAEPTRAPIAQTAVAVKVPTAAASPPSAAPTAAAATDGAIPNSVTAEGYHVFGRPDAPVTLVMYSDFL